MSTHLLKKGLFFVFSMVAFNNLATAQRSDRFISSVYEQYERALTGCGDCLERLEPGGDTYAVDKLADELASIEKDISSRAKDRRTIAYDFLEMAISIKLNEIEQARIEYEAPEWHDERSYKNFQGVIERKLYSWKKAFQSQGEAWDKVQGLDERSKDVLLSMTGLSTDAGISKGWFDGKLWKLRSEALENRIADAEDFLYRKRVPDHTLLQLDNFISFAVYGQEGRNRNLSDAFSKYFMLYNSDGEKTTIDSFDELMKSKGRNTVWHPLYRAFKQTKAFEDERNLAVEADRLLNGSANSSTSELKDFIRRAAPRETALVALRKLCEKPIADKDYGRALSIVEEVEPYFESKLLYERTIADFSNFRSAIGKYADSVGDVSFEAAPTAGDINTSADEIRFFFSRYKNYMAVIPYNRGCGVFSPDSVSWNLVEEPSCNLASYEYFFDYLPRYDQESKLLEKQSDFLYKFSDISRAFRGAINIDYHRSHEHKVAFFVSSSAYQRHDPSFVEKTDAEYISPWSISPGITLQDRSSSVGFHGRVRGNANTDIYYAVTNPDGISYGRPISLDNTVNTPFSERSPVLSEDGNTLYFSSEGHGSLGGYDVFKVPVRVTGGRVEVIGQVEHIVEACSEADELYYQKIREGTKQEQVFFASNRGERGDFDVYELRRVVRKPNGTPPRPDEGNLDSPSPDEEKFLPDWPKGKLLLELECDTFKNATKITPTGHIWVRGRIYDSQGRLIKSGRITFTNINSRGASHDILEHDSGRYSALLKEGVRYQIVITATTVDNKGVEEYLNKYIELCTQNLTGNKYAHQDHQLRPIKKLQEERGETGFDFFFDTNKFVSSINNMETVEAYWRTQLKVLADMPSYKLRLEGYADVRGDETHNFNLARNRVNTVARYLKDEIGFSDSQLDLKVYGETERFNNYPDKDLEVIIPMRALNMEGQNKKWLKNRRVRIVFIE